MISAKRAQARVFARDLTRVATSSVVLVLCRLANALTIAAVSSSTLVVRLTFRRGREPRQRLLHMDAPLSSSSVAG